MARAVRVHFEGAIYHVTFRGNERRDIFRDERDRERMLWDLAERRDRFGIRLYLVCLMPNHVHLLLETPRGNLSPFMQSLLTGYTVYFNRRHGRAGHLMQGRYGAQLVEGDEYLLRLSRYVHLNPAFTGSALKRPLAERLEVVRSYRWSTYRGYAGRDKRWDVIDYEPILRLVSGGTRKGYGRYVEAGLAETDKEWLHLIRSRPAVLGSEVFRTSVAQRREEAARDRRRDDVALRQMRTVVPAGRVLESVGDVLGVSGDVLLRRQRGTMLRSVVAWSLHRYAGLNQRQIATRLGLSTGAAVSSQLRKWRHTVERGGRWRRVEAQLERLLGGKGRTNT